MMAWLRLYDGILDDPKIQMLSDRAFRMLINLWCLAKRRGGTLPADTATLSFALRWPEGKVRDTLQALISAKLIDKTADGYEPHDWSQHQYDSDSAAERMRRYRERQRDVTKDKKKRNALRNSDAIEPDTEQNQNQNQRQNRTKKEVSAEPQTARAPAVPQEQPIVSLPTNRQGEEVPIFQAQALDYAKTYPNADVPQQFREMRRWLIDNPTKRKTARGMPKFINSWLSREQDKPNGTGRAGPSRTEGKQTRALGNFLEETRNETGNDAGRGTTGPPVPSERRALPLAASESDDNERGFGPASDGDGRSFSAPEQHDGSGIDAPVSDILRRSTWAV